MTFLIVQRTTTRMKRCSIWFLFAVAISLKWDLLRIWVLSLKLSSLSFSNWVWIKLLWSHCTNMMDMNPFTNAFHIMLSVFDDLSTLEMNFYSNYRFKRDNNAHCGMMTDFYWTFFNVHWNDQIVLMSLVRRCRVNTSAIIINIGSLKLIYFH